MDGVRGDVVLLPACWRTLVVVPVPRVRVVGVGVAEQRTEPRQVVLRGADQAVEVVVPDLVAQVPEQGAVRLVHRDPQLRAVHVVTLGEVQCDDAVLVAGERLSPPRWTAGRMPARTPDLGRG